ncbi:ExeM/NucH family extracellular endonuclease [Arcanobacterium phocisimile]|uniref:ExeM/NucH family extracellular endonuclease n=1 Tax=Arcanobacterium phocisimile TaxID=1302235 RepID=A0ABX7IHX4_9ACTO|nr:ExeM/NucH family extracellular endonuclease [Arcanobacterium phocisimile]QRV02340.1 ExeM/NucH family extracellular endonuclease [Arcanobacterium phocisimile]
MKLSRSMKVMSVATASLLGLPLVALPAHAAENTVADHVVINEVYVDGTENRGTYRDFVELYNPTTSSIDLSNYVLQGYSRSGNKSGSQTDLTGTIAPHGYYLVAAREGNPEIELNADSTDGRFKMSASKEGASIGLFDKGSVPSKLNKNFTAVDLVGWGTKAIGEGKAIPGAAKKEKSFQRTVTGVDTNDNSADFSISAATPQSSGVAVPDVPDVPDAPDVPGPDDSDTPVDPADPQPDPITPPVAPAQTLTIAQIQGTGDKTPYADQRVTTTGVVTAVYPYGGFQGFYVQTPGTGGDAAGERTASDGIFVYVGNFKNIRNKTGVAPGTIAVGDYLEVTGMASEYYGLTQVSVYDKAGVNPDYTVTKLDKGDDVVAPEPVKVERIPDVEEAREKLEGMLVQVTGNYTVTANYLTNRHGRLDLAPGNEPFRIPSDQTADKTQWPELAAKIERERIALDDGASIDYTSFGSKNKRWPNYNNPVPYLDVNNPLRVGTVIKLPQPMILDYRANSVGRKKYENRWNLQPTKPLSDYNDKANTEWTRWVSFTSTRQDAPTFAEGNVTITSFNVLNYFTTLGEDVDKCSAYSAYDGTKLTTNRCEPRGAYSQAAFKMQESKIVKAINALDSSVVGLEEIENSVKFGKDRDFAIAHLVEVLNTDAGTDKWAYVKSPVAEKLPDLKAQDVIRLAFIYQKDQVQPVDESKVLYDGDQWTYARQPLAQKFQALKDGEAEGKPFVVVLNHLKSKGSNKDTVPNDGYQGNNNHMRVEQVTEMAQWVAKNFADDAVFVLGDLNSYTHEDPLVKLEKEFGYESIAEKMGVTNHSYQYGGVVGSLDHALGNPAAMAMVKDADVWNVNAMEPVAFEYSRWNYNVNFENLFDGKSPFRSSDHDPIKVAIDTRDPQPETVEVAPIEPSAADPATCEIQPFVEVTPVDGVKYTVSVDGVELAPLADNANKFEYPYGKTVIVRAEPLEGFMFAEGQQTQWQWTALTRKELGCSIAWTELVPATPIAPEPQPEKPGIAWTELVPATPIAPQPQPQLEPEPQPQPQPQPAAPQVVAQVSEGQSMLAKTGADVLALGTFAALVTLAGIAFVMRRKDV